LATDLGQVLNFIQAVSAVYLHELNISNVRVAHTSSLALSHLAWTAFSMIV